MEFFISNWERAEAARVGREGIFALKVAVVFVCSSFFNSDWWDAGGKLISPVLPGLRRRKRWFLPFFIFNFYFVISNGSNFNVESYESIREWLVQLSELIKVDLGS